MDIFCLTAQKKSPLKLVGGWLCLVLCILCLLLSFGQWLFFIACVVFGFLFWFFIIKGSIEYEVSWLDGDIRFARIRAKSWRKALKHYRIDDVIQIAPGGDRSVYHYENDKTVKVFDYTSKKKDVPYYDMIIKSDDNVSLYKLELDDKFLNAVCIKNSFKVIRRKVQ